MPNEQTCDIGLIGLAVMGQNLVLNMESKGFTVAVYNRTTSVTQKLMDEWTVEHKNIHSGDTLEEFVALLAKPRKVMIMVKAGAPVDAVIAQLEPLLEPGDVIIDGGNSLFTDTMRREKELKEKGLLFVGCGVSGGEEGALKGPSMMPGGDMEAYKLVEPIFTKISAQVVDTLKNDGSTAPCVTYIGPNGAGHYVKMVHNGIEYGDMQLICEAYALLKGALGMEPPELHDVFADWNKGTLESFFDSDHRRYFFAHRPGHRQAFGRHDHGQSRAKGHRQMDATKRAGFGRAGFDNQRRRRTAHREFDERSAHRGFQSVARPRTRNVWGRPQRVH